MGCGRASGRPVGSSSRIPSITHARAPRMPDFAPKCIGKTHQSSLECRQRGDMASGAALATCARDGLADHVSGGSSRSAQFRARGGLAVVPASAAAGHRPKRSAPGRGVRGPTIPASRGCARACFGPPPETIRAGAGGRRTFYEGQWTCSGGCLFMHSAISSRCSSCGQCASRQHSYTFIRQVACASVIPIAFPTLPMSRTVV